MKNKLVYVISFALLFSFISFGVTGFKVSAATNDIESKIVDIAEKNNLEIVGPNLISEDQLMNFDTIEDFEKFIQEDENVIIEEENTIIKEDTTPLFSTFSTPKPVTHTHTEYNGTGKIVSYARVTKNSSKKITNVTVWSEQLGIIFGITYTPNDTASYSELNKAKTGGKAYALGSKLYGANVVGQPIGYKKKVTYTIKF